MTTTKQKKKLCWNCEGSTSFEEENCPYCGVYLSPLSVGGNEQGDSILNPPYQINPEEKNDQDDIPSSPYPQNLEEDEDSSDQSHVIEHRDEGLLLPLVILSAGFVFTLFSFALLLFSQNGKLTLSWNTDYWFLYLTIGVALLLFSWKNLNSKGTKGS